MEGLRDQHRATIARLPIDSYMSEVTLDRVISGGRKSAQAVDGLQTMLSTHIQGANKLDLDLLQDIYELEVCVMFLFFFSYPFVMVFACVLSHV